MGAGRGAGSWVGLGGGPSEVTREAEKRRVKVPNDLKDTHMSATHSTHDGLFHPFCYWLLDY